MKNEIIIDLKQADGSWASTRYCVFDRHALNHAETSLMQCKAGNARVGCGCGGRDQKPIPLAIFLWRDRTHLSRPRTEPPARKPRLRLKAGTAYKHHPLCIWRLAHDGEHPLYGRETWPSIALFRPLGEVERASFRGEGNVLAEATRRRATTFFRFGSKAIAEGLVAAWRFGIESGEVDPTRGIAPDAGQIARGIDWHFRNVELKEGGSPADASRALGVRLIHGICLERSPATPDDRPTESDTPLRLYVYERNNGAPQLRRFQFSAPPNVMEVASASLRTLCHAVKPPYYFVAVSEPQGRLRRLAFYPVHYDQQHLIFVDSGLERVCGADLIAQGACLIKPPDRSVIAELAKLHPSLRWLARIPPEQLVDFVVVGHGAPHRVIELAGFDERFVGYTSHLNTKAEKAARSDAYQYEILKGKDYEREEDPPMQHLVLRLPLCHT